MKIITSVKSLRHTIDKFKGSGKTIGFVPTMGFLHEGHASLLRQSGRDVDVTVLSIFVNPLQFGPAEDLKNYPRDIKKDELLAKKENVDIIFYPSVDEIYPTGFLTHVYVDDLSDRLCGKSRPGHFGGVATVVLKLVNMVDPDVMYLGQKDAQQAVIVRKMLQDLNVPVKVKILPTVREADGLAMSSRNSYLSLRERREAIVLYKALNQAKTLIKNGERTAKTIVLGMAKMIQEESQGIIDYIQCVNAQNLSVIDVLKNEVLIVLAVKFGRARLIDNIIVRVNE
ncbi:MAG: pantoate--beta-alanine ligase [Candidatus Omnitrophica bacterium]|nr:pantoate--beta-alanine ligase [Candidatus Omnitrophota bacterium]